MGHADILVLSQLSSEVSEPAAVPLGRWAAEVLAWTNENVRWLGDVVLWPFTQVLENVLIPLELLSPWWIVAGLFIVAWAKSPLTTALKACGALALTIGLGETTSSAAMKSFIIVFLTVLLVGIVAVPLGRLASGSGIAESRSWLIERLGLVQPWVLMAPTVFLFGIGEAASMLLATIYAFPIAFFTAAGNRSDDGLNRAIASLRKSVLPALWIHILAAIMGAGGLGTMLFRGINNLSSVDVFNAGIAAALVGYALQQLFSPASPNLLGGMLGVSADDDLDTEGGIVSVQLTPDGTAGV